MTSITLNVKWTTINSFQLKCRHAQLSLLDMIYINLNFSTTFKLLGNSTK